MELQYLHLTIREIICFCLEKKFFTGKYFVKFGTKNPVVKKKQVQKVQFIIFRKKNEETQNQHLEHLNLI